MKIIIEEYETSPRPQEEIWRRIESVTKFLRDNKFSSTARASYNQNTFNIMFDYAEEYDDDKWDILLNFAQANKLCVSPPIPVEQEKDNKTGKCQWCDNIGEYNIHQQYRSGGFYACNDHFINAFQQSFHDNPDAISVRQGASK